MDDAVVFKVGDLVRFKTERNSKKWPGFTFGSSYEISEVYIRADDGTRVSRLWDDKHSHCWWQENEDLELVTPESTIDIWATP